MSKQRKLGLNTHNSKHHITIIVSVTTLALNWTSHNSHIPIPNVKIYFLDTSTSTYKPFIFIHIITVCIQNGHSYIRDSTISCQIFKPFIQKPSCKNGRKSPLSEGDLAIKHHIEVSAPSTLNYCWHQKKTKK